MIGAHPRSVRYYAGEPRSSALVASNGDPRRWPLVAFTTADAVRLRDSREAHVTAMVTTLLDCVGIIDPDLRTTVARLYEEWLTTPGHADLEIEAVVINALDAAIDEQDRRDAQR
jgi:hypothetical protein